MFTTENICPSEKDIERFWSKVDVRGPDECWNWKTGKTKFGHGVFSIRHQWITAHRVSFYLAKGYLPEHTQGRLVMHDCENPSCVNPKHLLDGTIKENGGYEGHKKKQRDKVGHWRGRYGKANTARYGKKHSDATKELLRAKALEREKRKAKAGPPP